MKNRLLDELEACTRQGCRYAIRDWMISWVEGKTVSIGSRGHESGGVYAPPRSGWGISGGLYVRWEDGRISRQSLTRQLMEDPKSLIAFMIEAAFEDPYPPDVPDPEPPADVPVYSADIDKITQESPRALEPYIEMATETFKELETKNCQAGASCAFQRRMIANSRGLSVGYDATSIGFAASADSLYSVGKTSREWIDSGEVQRYLRHLKEMIRILRKTVAPSDRVSTLVMPPPTASGFIGRFIMGNLTAGSIYDGQSAYGIDDVNEKRALYHPTLNLHHDPCIPMHPGAYPIDSQGLPAKPVTFIKNGCLENVQVSLKGAKQTGWAPNPSVSMSCLDIQGGKELDFFDFVSDVDSGYIVTSVLGLHTQSSGSGDYSVVCPHGVVVRNGKMIGTAKGVLSGNFFRDLNREITVLTSPYHLFKGIAYSGSIKF